MDNLFTPEDWLKRAYSNLIIVVECALRTSTKCLCHPAHSPVILSAATLVSKIKMNKKDKSKK